MKTLFAVIRSRGPAWNEARAMEEQKGWRAHAEFMDGLHAEGFALLVGPLEGTEDALLIVRASDADEVRQRLSADPWGEDMLRLRWMAPWTLRLGSLSATVRVTRRFSATPERVFDAWLDPGTAGQWLFATASGRMVRVEIDARVGGKFAFVDRREGENVEHVGAYLEIERPRRLVFTFAVPKFSPQATCVALDIAPLETGCALTLSHEGVLPEYASRTEAGWATILDGLGRRLPDAGAA